MVSNLVSNIVPVQFQYGINPPRMVAIWQGPSKTAIYHETLRIVGIPIKICGNN